MFKHHGMRTFFIIWLGQALTFVGTAMTQFALIIWAYEMTGQVTTLALMGFAGYAIHIMIKPFAGVWADRWDRRTVMILSDLAAGGITVSLLVLLVTDQLAIWHLYAGELLTGAFVAFQRPAYNAVVGVLVPREQLARAHGLRSLGADFSQILAPVLAGLALRGVGLAGVLVIDIITVGAAVGTLLIVQIPRPHTSDEGASMQNAGFRAQFAFVGHYITQRRGLLYLVLAYGMINFFGAVTYFGIMPAMVLARSGNNELALSSVQTAFGIGGVIGGVIVTATGGPRRKIDGVLGITAVSFLVGNLLFAIGRTPLVWSLAALIGAFCLPFVTSGDRAIWQSKVPPDIQGRVLGMVISLRELAFPLGFLIIGPLADRVFEPAMQPGGALAGWFGGLVGTGHGAGMALMFMAAALTGMTLCLSGYLSPALRRVETDLDDYDAALAPTPVLPAAAAAD